MRIAITLRYPPARERRIIEGKRTTTCGFNNHQYFHALCAPSPSGRAGVGLDLSIKVPACTGTTNYRGETCDNMRF